MPRFVNDSQYRHDTPEKLGVLLTNLGTPDAPETGATFSALPGAAADPKNYVKWSKMLKSHLYREYPLRLWNCRELKAISKPGESEGDFRVRLRQRTFAG